MPAARGEQRRGRAVMLIVAVFMGGQILIRRAAALRHLCTALFSPPALGRQRMLQERPALPAGASLRQPALPQRQAEGVCTTVQADAGFSPRVTTSAPERYAHAIPGQVTGTRPRGYLEQGISSAGASSAGGRSAGLIPGAAVPPRPGPHLPGLLYRAAVRCGYEYRAVQRWLFLRHCAGAASGIP